MDEVIDPALTVKIIGHQWYWSYEYLDFASIKMNRKRIMVWDVIQICLRAPRFRIPVVQNITETFKFDSYMIHEGELNVGDFRLLKTDMPLFLPKNTHIRLLITSSDVLHS